MDKLSSAQEDEPYGKVRLGKQSGLVRLSRELQTLLGQRLRRTQLASGYVKPPQAVQHWHALRDIAQLVTQRTGAEIVLFHRRRGPPLSGHQRRSQYEV